VRYHHIIDPTHRPFREQGARATIIGPYATRTDGCPRRVRAGPGESDEIYNRIDDIACIIVSSRHRDLFQGIEPHPALLPRSRDEPSASAGGTRSRCRCETVH